MSFTETNLVPNAGLLPAAALAQRIGLDELVDERVQLASESANGGAKALTVVGSMLAGGDSIDDTARLRAGAAGALFDDTRAPSTVGSWLRAHTWSNVRQLDAVGRELLVRLWAAGAGPADLAGPLTIDLDSSIVPVFGRSKQGAAFGYTKVRGYHPQFATCASTGLVLFSRLRGGSADAARGAKSFLTETVSRVRDAGATGQLTIRADSAFCSRSVLGTAAKLGVEFSVTARQDKKIRAAIDADRRGRVGADPVLALNPGGLWCRRRRDQLHRVLRQGRHHRPAGRAPGPANTRQPTRPVHLLGLPRVRHQPTRERVGDRGRPPSARDRRAADCRAQERRPQAPAVGEVHGQRGLAGLSVMAHNLSRAVGRLAGPDLDRATPTTLQQRIFTAPGRLVHSGRRRHLRLPANWPWAAAIEEALTATAAIPLRC